MKKKKSPEIKKIDGNVPKVIKKRSPGVGKMILVLAVLIIFLLVLMAYFPLVEPMPSVPEVGMPGV